MNKTPKLRFKEFSGDWESKKLGDVAQIVGGGTPSTTESEYWNGNIPWFTPTEIKLQKFVSMSERTITEVGLKKSSAKILPKGTVLLTTRASLGDMAIANQEVTTNQGFQSIVAGNDINNEFIYYLQSKLKKYCYKNASGSTFLEISKSNIEQFKFNMPLKEEQEKIASFFSLIDDKISLQGEKLEMLKDYKKGMMQKIFSRELRFKDDYGRDYPDWDETKLGNYIIEYKEKTTENNQYPVLTSARQGIVLQKDYFKDRQVTTDDNIGYHIIPRGYLTYRSRSDDSTFKFNQNNIIDIGIVSYFYPVFKFNEELNSTYALVYMNNYLGYQIRREIVGTSQLVLSLNKLKDLKIQVPCIEEQNKIGNVLESLDNKINKEQEKLDSLNEYKKGLLQQMFV